MCGFCTSAFFCRRHRTWFVMLSPVLYMPLLHLLWKYSEVIFVHLVHDLLSVDPFAITSTWTDRDEHLFIFFYQLSIGQYRSVHLIGTCMKENGAVFRFFSFLERWCCWVQLSTVKVHLFLLVHLLSINLCRPSIPAGIWNRKLDQFFAVHRAVHLTGSRFAGIPSCCDIFVNRRDLAGPDGGTWIFQAGGSLSPAVHDCCRYLLRALLLRAVHVVQTWYVGWYIWYLVVRYMYMGVHRWFRWYMVVKSMNFASFVHLYRRRTCAYMPASLSFFIFYLNIWK